MTTKTQNKEAMVLRFRPSVRFEHLILLITFTGLGLTGIPQKYASHAWAEGMISIMGGIETVRIIHRIMATGLMAESIYHIGMIGFKLFVLGEPPYLLPSVKDGKDLVGVMLYNLGFKKEHPEMGRFNFEEKLEYWAVIWGMGIMIITGFMLWNPIATTQLMPGQIIPAAKQAHGQEALLAVIAIVTWHFYNVLTHNNFSIFTGFIRRKTMEEKHALELAEIDAGESHQPPPKDVIRKRLYVYAPIAFLFAAVLLVGLVWFVSFEQSAITTLPPLAP